MEYKSPPARSRGKPTTLERLDLALEQLQDNIRNDLFSFEAGLTAREAVEGGGE